MRADGAACGSAGHIPLMLAIAFPADVNFTLYMTIRSLNRSCYRKAEVEVHSKTVSKEHFSSPGLFFCREVFLIAACFLSMGMYVLPFLQMCAQLFVLTHEEMNLGAFVAQ